MALLTTADRNSYQSVVGLMDKYNSNPNYYSLLHTYHHSNMDWKRTLKIRVVNYLKNYKNRLKKNASISLITLEMRKITKLLFISEKVIFSQDLLIKYG